MRSLGVALAFLTRLPTWDPGVLPPEALGPPTRWFPVVGVLVGVLVAVTHAAVALILPATIAALVAVAAGVMITGALHEDGLADLADAAGARGDADQRKAAMKDPRLGAFGVLALIFSIGLRSAALVTLGPGLASGWLVLAHTLSRGALVVPLRLAASDGPGLQAAVSKAVRPIDVTLAAGGSALFAIGWLGPWALGPVAVCVVAYALPVAWARRRLGGVSGDVLGAGQQLAETGVLLLAAALVTTGSHPALPFWR